MIRINGQEYFYLPRNIDKQGELVIEFENTTTHQKHSVIREDLSKNSVYYKVESVELEPGEYEYTARIEEEVVDKGLCVVEEIESSKETYAQEVKYAVYGQ